MKIAILGAGPGGFSLATDLFVLCPYLDVTVGSYPNHLCESFVHIASALNQVNYWKEGRDIQLFF